MTKLDDATLESLTEEEIAALEEDEDEGGSDEIEADDGAEGAADAPEEDESDEDEPEEDGDEADEPPAPAAKPAEAAPAPTTAPAVADEEAMPAAPVAKFSAEDATRLEAIATERAKLITAADEGEETFEDLGKKLAALEREAAKLEIKKEADAEALAAYRTQADVAWNRSVSAWFKAQGLDQENPESLPDAVFEGFDAVVQQVTGSGLASGLSVSKTLDMALAAYQAKAPGKWPGKAAATPPAKPGKPARGQREVLIPPRIDDIAAPAEGGGVEDGRYAALDRLMERDPDKYEAKLAGMSEAARDAYLASR